MVMMPRDNIWYKEVADEEPQRMVSVRKVVWDAAAQQWCERIYVRVVSRSEDDLQQWLNQKHGPPRYHGQWWRQHGHGTQFVWMLDTIATVWFLTRP